MLLLPLFCLLIINAVAAEPEYVPTIKGAIVNGEKLPAEEVRKYYDNLLRIYKKPGKEVTKPLRDKLAEVARDRTIYQLVQRQMIAKNKLTIDAEGLKEELANLKQELTDEGKSWADTLEASGKTEDEFVKSFEPRLIQRRYMAAELNKGDELAALKKKFEDGKDKVPLRRASHILINFEKCKFTTHPERKREDALALAKAATERAKNGEDFADLVKEFSDHTVSRLKGGDLDWLPKEFPDPSQPKSGKSITPMPKPFTDALYSLEKVGDITKEPVETELGFHIIKLTGLITDEDAFKSFMRIAVRTRTMDLQNKLFKEAKIEELKE